jgi:hypothetical protein
VDIDKILSPITTRRNASKKINTRNFAQNSGDKSQEKKTKAFPPSNIIFNVLEPKTLPLRETEALIL